MSKVLKACPFCGEQHKTNKIANIIDYDGEGHPILGEYKNVVSMLVHGRNDFIPLDVWQSRPIEDALRAELELSRKIAGEAIKQTETLTEQLDDSNRKLEQRIALEIDEHLKVVELQAKLDMALRVLNKLNEFDYTESGVNWEIKSGITEIKRIGGKNE